MGGARLRERILSNGEGDEVYDTLERERKDQPQGNDVKSQQRLDDLPFSVPWLL